MDYNSIFDTDQKKACAFDEIAELYYNHNFSSAPKSSIDALMFKLFSDRLKEKISFEGDYLNKPEYADLNIAKQLGISPSKVANMKMKCALLFPEDNVDWKIQLRSILSSSSAISRENGRIKIPIQDKMLYCEVHNHFVNNNEFVDRSLGSSALEIREDSFLKLCEIVLEKDEKAEMVKALKKYAKTCNISNPKSTLDIVEQIVSTGKDFTEIIINLTEILNPGNIVIGFIKNTFKSLIENKG